MLCHAKLYHRVSAATSLAQTWGRSGVCTLAMWFNPPSGVLG